MNINKERIIQIYVIFIITYIWVFTYVQMRMEALIILWIIHFPFVFAYILTHSFVSLIAKPRKDYHKETVSTMSLKEVFTKKLIPDYWKSKFYNSPLLFWIYNTQYITTQSNIINEYNISQVYINKRELCYNFFSKKKQDIQTLNNIIVWIHLKNKPISTIKRKHIWVSINLEPLVKKIFTWFDMRIVILSFPIVNFLHFLFYRWLNWNYVDINTNIIIWLNILIVWVNYYYFTHKSKNSIMLESTWFEQAYSIIWNDPIVARRVFDPDVIEKCSEYKLSNPIYIDLQQWVIYCDMYLGSKLSRPSNDFITKKATEMIDLLEKLLIIKKSKNIVIDQ